MDPHELARIFHETALLLELKGENPFKARAYYNAARTLENLGGELETLVKEERLRQVPGFGEAIVHKVLEWARTGKIEYYETLKNTTPPGLLEFLRLPGLGPKKINQIYKGLGITTLEALEEACAQNQLLSLSGFGVRTQEKIYAGIRFLKEHRGQFLWPEVIGAAADLREELAGHPAVLRVDLAGSLRRCKPLVEAVDLVAVSREPQAVLTFFTGLPVVDKVTGSDQNKSSVRLKTGVAAHLRVVREEEYPHALQYFTGSKEHNTALRRRAEGLGYKLNASGLLRGEERLSCREEEEIYQWLGLPWIPPELREGLGETEIADESELPALVRDEEIRGVFHVHTTYSDGINTLEEMAAAAAGAGYEYMGVADHSRSAFYARGLSKEALAAQGAEIDRLNREYRARDFIIFKGTEADILPSGDLDYDPESLEQLDFVIGSVHSHFQMGRKEMTARILRAMDNPYLTMLGHPTGRILLERPPYELDLEAVLDKAAAKGIIIEFNANPYRLDLDWTWLRRAKEMGVRVAVNPDAHSTGELNLVKSSLPVVRKGWLEKMDVFNTRTAAEVRQYFNWRKRTGGGNP